MRLYGADRVSKTGRYLDRDLWTTDTAGYPWPGRVGMRLLRLLVVVARAPFDGHLNLEAAALVYRTLLSIVPLLAVAFSMLKAFGAQYRIEPLLVQMLSPLGASAAEVARRIVEFVSNVGVSVLGTVGLIGLFYTVVSVIEGIENALNQIWHVRRSRPLMRKFSDYLSILLVGPVLVFTALGIIASAQSSRLIQRVLALTPFTQETVALFVRVAPFVLLVAAFTLLFRFLPYTRVAPGAALVGGDGCHSLAPRGPRFRSHGGVIHKLPGDILELRSARGVPAVVTGRVARLARRRPGRLHPPASDVIRRPARAAKRAPARACGPWGPRRDYAPLPGRRLSAPP